MKFNSSKILIALFSLFIVSLFIMAFADFPWGYVGTTKKNGEALGCICHGGGVPNDTVIVQIFGPDSVAVGQTATYRIKISRGPAIAGGFNVASDTGFVDALPGDTSIHQVEYPPGSGIFEITHTYPKMFSNDTVSWSFKYTAPNFPVIDTLFATANSTNHDTTSDNDAWNWSPNKPVRIYSPIGIINTSTIAKGFSLGQNYPNPFNPTTQINFSVGKTSDVEIKVYDMLGNLVSTLVNQNLKQGEYKTDFNGSGLASGTYFYSMFSDGEKIMTKKMLIIK